jgi:hypothetical protein
LATKSDDWMFGDAGLPGKPAPPDVTSQPTDRVEAIRKGEPEPPPVEKPAPAPVAPPPPPTGDSRASAGSPPRPAATEAEKLRQKVLDHTNKLRRALLEGSKPAAAPPAPVASTAPALVASAPHPVAPAPSAPAPPGPAPPPTIEPAKATSSADDSAALRRALVEQTRKTTLKDLEKKGLKNVAVLDMKTIERIVSEAVEKAIDKRPFTATQKRALEQDAKREFLELLDEHKRAVAERSDEERRRLDLEKQVEKLRAELSRQEAVLSEQRASATVAISAASLAELEASCKALLREFMTAERRALTAEANPKAEEGLAALEKKLAEVFDRLVGRIKSDYEDLLERRIDKLNNALAETENALRAMAQMKSIDPGIASIYSTVQGLSLDELNYGRKKELLAIVFLENLEIQKKTITEADRAAAVIKSTLEPARPSLDAPEGFEPPLDPLTTETAF